VAYPPAWLARVYKGVPNNYREVKVQCALPEVRSARNLLENAQHACKVLRCLPRDVRMRAKALKVRVNHRWLVESMHLRHSHCFTGHNAGKVLTGVLGVMVIHFLSPHLPE
jgi:hypothetical protein